MSKKILLSAAAVIGFAFAANAQTNLQTFYDFGSDRGHFTTTLEMFKGDNWGNTFFFVDYDYNNRNKDNKVVSPSGTYFEIARCLNFWQESALAPLSLQVEYNGGVYGPNAYAINSAFLVGVDWFLHSKDFKNTLNLKVLYKNIVDTKSNVPLQFTAVWGCDDIFGIKGLRFSGFADFWWQEHLLFTDKNGALTVPATSQIVFLSEPQLWYNIGRFIGVDNFNIGGEVELSYDFGSAKGFWARPCIGTKWNF